MAIAGLHQDVLGSVKKKGGYDMWRIGFLAFLTSVAYLSVYLGKAQAEIKAWKENKDECAEMETYKEQRKENIKRFM